MGPGRLASIAVLAGALLAACDVQVAPANPNNCRLRAHDPHESSSNPGTLSANVQVTCGTAPSSHRTTLTMFRSPVGANDWERIGGNQWNDGAVANINHDLHSQNIQCPGGTFDYYTTATHRYTASGNTFTSRPVDSNLRTISC